MMASPVPMHSALKKSQKTPRVNNSINFAEREMITMAERDYGLMQVTAVSGTPHPRVLTNINMEALKERLELEQDKHTKRRKSHPESLIQATNLKPEYPPVCTKTHFINQQQLQDEDSTDPDTIVTPWRNKTKVGGSGNALSVVGTSRGSSRQPPGRITIGERQKRSLLKCEKIEQRTKIVSIAMDAINDSFRGASATSTTNKNNNNTNNNEPEESSTTSSDGDAQRYMSFSERRRLFQEGEFTIAKNGRKMSDILMPLHVQSSFVLNDHMDSEAERARDAIEVYIKKQGFIMAPSGTLTNLRRYSSNLSKRSTISVNAFHAGKL